MKVIVTGASMGIGRGIAVRLARHGCEIGALARSEDALASLSAEIQATDGVCHTAVCDVRDADATQAAIGGLIARMGGLDALVNNAGVVIRKSIFDLTLDEWRAMLETNVGGVFNATRAVLDLFRAQGRGHIINLSSIAGKVPLADGSAYAATKFAVTGFSQSLFQELRGLGIKVTTIYPGSVDSASHRHDPEADQDWKVTPEEVGEAIWAALDTRHENAISEIEIRPLRKGAG